MIQAVVSWSILRREGVRSLSGRRAGGKPGVAEAGAGACGCGAWDERNASQVLRPGVVRPKREEAPGRAEAFGWRGAAGRRFGTAPHGGRLPPTAANRSRMKSNPQKVAF